MPLVNQQTTTVQKGIPGKLFVVPFVVMLVLLCGLMIAVAIRFQTIMARLEESRSLWPEASKELAPRYAKIDETFMSGLTGEAKGIDWIGSKEQFRGSTLFDRQASASLAIENQIAKANRGSQPSEGVPAASDLKSPGIANLVDAERRRKIAQGDFIGWLTIRALRLKLPDIYDPTASNQ